MRCGRFVIASLLGIVSLAACHADNPSQRPRPTEEAALPLSWPPTHQTEELIWPHGAPDMGGTTLPPEQLQTTRAPDVVAGRPYRYISNVSAPTMTIFPPQGMNTGAAMVVFPGGGFEILAIDLEGTEICDWVTRNGITCILLKYRVPGTNDQYDRTCRCHRQPRVLTSLQDAQRTIRLIRSRAQTLGLDPNKIGVIGFSAGGYLVAQTSNIVTPNYAPIDTADLLSSRPDFALAIYPGHIWRPPGFRIDPTLNVSGQTPPTFIVQAWDDDVDDVNQSLVYARALEMADVSTEVHLFAHGGHAFGIRATDQPITRWPVLAEAWLRSIGILPATVTDATEH